MDLSESDTQVVVQVNPLASGKSNPREERARGSFTAPPLRNQWTLVQDPPETSARVSVAQGLWEALLKVVLIQFVVMLVCGIVFVYRDTTTRCNEWKTGPFLNGHQVQQYVSSAWGAALPAAAACLSRGFQHRRAGKKVATYLSAVDWDGPDWQAVGLSLADSMHSGLRYPRHRPTPLSLLADLPSGHVVQLTIGNFSSPRSYLEVFLRPSGRTVFSSAFVAENGVWSADPNHEFIPPHVPRLVHSPLAVLQHSDPVALTFALRSGSTAMATELIELQGIRIVMIVDLRKTEAQWVDLCTGQITEYTSSTFYNVRAGTMSNDSFVSEAEWLAHLPRWLGGNATADLTASGTYVVSGVPLLGGRLVAVSSMSLLQTLGTVAKSFNVVQPTLCDDASKRISLALLVLPILALPFCLLASWWLAAEFGVSFGSFNDGLGQFEECIGSTVSYDNQQWISELHRASCSFVSAVATISDLCLYVPPNALRHTEQESHSNTHASVARELSGDLGDATADIVSTDDVKDARRRNQIKQLNGTYLTVSCFGLRSMAEQSLQQAGDAIASIGRILARHIGQHDGVVEDPRPSCILVSFGIRRPHPFPDIAACRAAMGIASSMASPDDEDAIMCRGILWSVVITGGRTIAGTCGTTTSRNTVVCGDPVVLAQTMPALIRMYNSRVMLTDTVYSSARAQVKALPIDVVEASAHGGQTVTVYELRGADTSKNDTKVHDDYLAAFSHFCSLKLQSAGSRLLQYACGEGSGDPQVLRLLKVCLAYKDQQAEIGSTVRNGERKYVRHFPVWAHVEEDAALVSFPQELTKYLGADETQVFVKRSRRRSTAKESLMTEISKTIGVCRPRRGSRRMSMNPDVCEDTIVAMSLSTDPTTDIPTEFVDRRKGKWVRTETILGARDDSRTYLGLGEDGQMVAIRVTPIPRNASIGAITALVDDVAQLTSIQHPNIIDYYASCVVGKYLLVVTECVSGRTLDVLLDQVGPLPVEVVRRYCRCVLQGLQHLHQRKSVHKALTSANVIVAIDGTAKLKGATQSPHQKEVGDDVLVLATLYRAPETSIETPQFTPASDIWAFAVLLAESLTAEVPWDVGDVDEVTNTEFLECMAETPEFKPEIPERLNKLVPRPAMSIFNRCLARDPADRPSATDLLTDPFFM